MGRFFLNRQSHVLDIEKGENPPKKNQINLIQL